MNAPLATTATVTQLSPQRSFDNPPFDTQPRDIILDEVEFCAWVAAAEPGDSIVYYRGHLSHDRTRSAKVHPDAARKRLAILAGRALALAEEGSLHLVQKRLAVGAWAYVAIKSRKQQQKGRAAALFEQILEEEAA